jgi:hypothetical protein
MEARRVEFRISNFEHQREALQTMQETLARFSTSVRTEIRRRRKEEYVVFDLKPPFTGASELMEGNQEYQPMLASRIKKMQTPPSEDDRRWLDEITSEILEYALLTKSNAESTTSEVITILNRRDRFNSQLESFLIDFQVQIYRCGFDHVIDAGNTYVESVLRWNDHIVSDGVDELVERMNIKRDTLNRTIASAIYHGPYVV